MAAPDRRGWPLELGPADIEALAGAVAARLAAFEAGRAEAPTTDMEGLGPLLAAAAAPPPEAGRPLEDLLDLVMAGAAKGFDTGGPGFMAYVPSGGIVSSAVAEMLALGLNRYTGIAAAAPVLAGIEAGVIDWCAGLFGLPGPSRGVLVSGGSIANLTATVTARTRRLGDDLAGARLYVSAQGHHSVAKAARVAGLPRDAVRLVPVDRALRMDPDALAAMVAEDRRAGLRPFMAVGTCGTTNTGALDPLPEIAAICRGAGLWLHVDAAYGGFFRLTERGRARTGGVEAADSITLDPHKGLLLPYGTGCVLVRDGDALRDAHRMDATYLQDLTDLGGVPDFADHSAELSREFRGLRAWLPLHLHGVAAFRAVLDESLDLAGHVHDALAQVPGLEVPWRPELSAVGFRVRTDAGVADPDAAGARLLARINASRRVFLSSTVIGGRYTLRVCLLVHRTHRDRVDEAVGIIRDAARAELGARAGVG
ncbi:MAG: aminotransferase class I/II-fold pyridoxal phosphate-dependent enzyme [Thermoleophilia bacterium]|nr:aminotransferase class I/II-fold pyridoxal phosphate-dependent enzyme [Thermoleophilia bacterium]